MIPGRAVKRVFQSVPRFLFVALLVLSSFYSILAYIPGTYIAFIQAPYQSWLPLFIRLQPYSFVLLAASLGMSLWSERADDGRSRRLLLEFFISMMGVAVYLFLARPFRSLHNDSHSFVLAVAAIFPILWIGVLDCRAHWRQVNWSCAINPCFSLTFVVLLPVAVSLTYPFAAYLRYKVAGLAAFPMHGVDLLVGAGAVFAHILFFTVMAGLLAISESLAWRARQPRKLRFVLFTVMAALGLALVMERVAFASIPFQRLESGIYSALFGLALAIFGAGLQLRAMAGQTAQPEAMDRQKRRAEDILLGLVCFLAACVVPGVIGIVDWNRLLEKTWVLVFWMAAAFTLIRLTPRRSRPLPIAVALALPVLAYTVYLVSFTSQRWSSPESPWQEAISTHSTYDASYTTVRDFMATATSVPCDESCRYFHEQTNIPPSMPPAAPELALVDHLQPATEPRPNIFIFVVDSLRQDYVTPYNSAVDHTPQIALFSRDSLVFRNAFTRYAGTTLSEPSIWAGAMLLHSHFVQPFSRVNNLERLVAVDGYQPFVTVDTTLRILLGPNQDLVRLDENVSNWTDTDLCSTVTDAEAKISGRRDTARPIFLYTQPQNVHLLTVQKRHPELLVHTREALARVYAQDLHRLDACFGSFISFLKRAGLYKNSVIVITADHGELGHDAHTSSVEPDIMRVPLIIHLPENLQKRLVYDTSKLAFTTDITPTLYYLLGHRPIRNDEVLGRPLITATVAEAAQYDRDSYLLGSSYSPNYGIIRENGRMFYAFDDARHSEALYDLASDFDGDKNLVTSAVATREKQAIRAHLARIAAEYGFEYKRTTLLSWLSH